MNKIKIVIVLFLLQYYTQSFAQNLIYIAAIGTDEKKELISENLNLYDKEITHVGIGFKSKNEIIVYHVTPNPEKLNNLEEESLFNFFGKKNISYRGLWELEINTDTYNELISEINYLKKKGVEYDFDFSLQNEKLYCSEFLANLLNEFLKFNFKPTIVGNNFLSVFLADFFLESEKFRKIY